MDLFGDFLVAALGREAGHFLLTVYRIGWQFAPVFVVILFVLSNDRH